VGSDTAPESPRTPGDAEIRDAPAANEPQYVLRFQVAVQDPELGQLNEPAHDVGDGVQLLTVIESTAIQRRAQRAVCGERKHEQQVGDLDFPGTPASFGGVADPEPNPLDRHRVAVLVAAAKDLAEAAPLADAIRFVEGPGLPAATAERAAGGRR
jgi:hypothetical protein